MEGKTMTAEEVAKTIETIRWALNSLPDGDSSKAWDAASDLAAQAARVPGLEEQSHADRYAICGALMWSGAWPLGVEKLKPSRHVSALLERLQQAESERDAARQEVERLGSYVEKLKLDVSGHVGVIHEQHETISELRERVATLEANAREAFCAYAVRLLNLERETWLLTWAGVARADTAEARVKDGHHAIEALRKALWTFLPEERAEWTSLNHRSDRHVWGDKVCALVGDEESDCTCGGGTEQGRLVEQALAALRDYDKVTSQPPPAPAQGVDRERLGREVRAEWVAWAKEQANPKPSWLVPWEGLSEPDKEVDRRIGERLYRLAFSTPTPPPGLREVVGPLMPWVKALSRSGMADDAIVSSVYPFSNRMTYGDLRRILAAYEATGGDHGPDATCPNCKEDHEDAAKYRAAVERMMQAVDRIPTPHSHQVLEVLRWLLSLDSNAPAPRATLDKARVVEVVQRIHTLCAEEDSSIGGRYVNRKWRQRIMDDLGLTLSTPPSGPEGGERKCDTCHGRGLDEIEPGTEVECGRCQGTGEDCLEDDDAPPHTPEVPPLKDECAAPEKRGCLAGDHVWWDDGESCACRATKRPVPDAIQPTAPAVVLERDGVPSCGGCGVHMCPGCASISTVVWRGGGIEVFIDGAVAALVVGGKPDWTQTAVTLARALAEAKRELTALGQEVTLKQTALNDNSRDYRDARKAAESMRERAAEAVLGVEADGRIAELVRALPLE